MRGARHASAINSGNLIYAYKHLVIWKIKQRKMASFSCRLLYVNGDKQCEVTNLFYPKRPSQGLFRQTPKLNNLIPVTSSGRNSHHTSPVDRYFIQERPMYEKIIQRQEIKCMITHITCYKGSFIHSFILNAFIQHLFQIPSHMPSDWLGDCLENAFIGFRIERAISIILYSTIT